MTLMIIYSLSLLHVPSATTKVSKRLEGAQEGPRSYAMRLLSCSSVLVSAVERWQWFVRVANYNLETLS